MKLAEETIPASEAGEIETLKAIFEGMTRNQEGVRKRAQHAKSHGCVKGTLQVLDGLPASLAVGVFATAREYPVTVRFSNGMGTGPSDDTAGDVRGMAIKVELSEGREQDFILVNTPRFFLKDVGAYLNFMPVAKAKKETGKIPPELAAQAQAISYAFPILQAIRELKVTSPLATRYWSATPYRLGEQAIKFSLVPQPGPAPFDPSQAKDPANYLREALTQQLAAGGATFDFLVQTQVDAEKMPIEDPTVEWDESLSPFVPVARLRLPSQAFNAPEQMREEETLSFSPWRTLPEHAPLGGVNRARRIYEGLGKVRQPT